MKKTLILVRHATAEDQSFRIKDFDRNLNSKGLSESLAMGKWLVEEGVKPDLLVSSPASRAFKTAEIIAGQYKIPVDAIQTQAGIYDGGPRAYLQAVTTVQEAHSTLMLFGHNPDITYFAEYLSGASIGSMKKGSAVFIEFKNQKWEEISAKTGDLVLYKTPKQIREDE
ncbi:SixA phosphatase family protein [Dyadobacter fermentans]|uniref:Putative phosphohistidine phosphatase, SixA n=1 Tax=Dyadobacter fermentans (strain ATCC 700827 / DSM 18053 / CIP 107007 / KCTC 52180 / NS114) TaxID=471854 RepID=C6W3N7_DYAFD|nr:histidine phosphatase family protein [Dyadobacter fermentans]ACT94014.1 putative phosphohistidine phosphatase, SixA [Dyadobacter fermentans DSM 18053]